MLTPISTPMRTAPVHAVDAGRIIKVNHAGEHGAVNIYAGQLAAARLSARGLLPELAAFKSHEERHRSIFAAELERRGVRRCRSYWLCGTGGYVLGLVTGLLGAQAIAIATVAVERVVLSHLHQQLLQIGTTDPAASAAIWAILVEEQQHHDQSATHLRRTGMLQRLLGAAVSYATEGVIWIGMHASPKWR